MVGRDEDAVVGARRMRHADAMVGARRHAKAMCTTGRRNVYSYDSRQTQCVQQLSKQTQCGELLSEEYHSRTLVGYQLIKQNIMSTILCKLCVYKTKKLPKKNVY